MANPSLNPFLLAANVPEPDARLLPLLHANPELASQQDSHGYSLLHAAASYSHADLLHVLVNEFKVDVNLKDEDGETCLFVAETVEIAQCLVEELHIDTAIQNDEGMTAMEKMASEDDYPEVTEYLQKQSAGGQTGTTQTLSSTTGNGIRHPPPLPPNVKISINTTTEDQVNDALEQDPDPHFRQRIEELASKENFNTEEAQKELRELITDAVREVGHEDRDVRRRVD